MIGFAILTAVSWLLMLGGQLALNRPMICPCHRIRVYSMQCSHLLCLFSLTHILHGVVFYSVGRLLGLSPTAAFGAAVAIEAAWEIVENTPPVIRWWATHGGHPFGDTMLNSTGDLLCCATGALLTSLCDLRLTLIGSATLGLLFGWRIRYREPYKNERERVD